MASVCKDEGTFCVQAASKLDPQFPAGFIGQVGIFLVRGMHVNLAFCAGITKALFCCLTFQSRTTLNQQIFVWEQETNWKQPWYPNYELLAFPAGIATQGPAGRPATPHTGSLSVRASWSWGLPILLSFLGCITEGSLCLLLRAGLLASYQLKSWWESLKFFLSIYISFSVSHALQTVTPTAFLPSCPDLLSTPARWWRRSARHAEPERVPILPSAHPPREQHSSPLHGCCQTLLPLRCQNRFLSGNATALQTYPCQQQPWLDICSLSTSHVHLKCRYCPLLWGIRVLLELPSTWFIVISWCWSDLWIALC